MTKRAPSRATAAERPVNTGAIEQAALGTTAAAMVLGILTGETHGKVADGTHNDAGTSAPPDAFHQPPSDPAGPITHAGADPGLSSSMLPGASGATPAWSSPDLQTDHSESRSLTLDQTASATSESTANTAVDHHTDSHLSIASFSSASVDEAQAVHGATSYAPAHEPSAGDIGLTSLVSDPSFVQDTVASLASDIPAIVSSATAAITELTASISLTVDTAVQSVLSAPTAVVGQLVDTAFHPQASPVPAADSLIDHSPLVATVAQLAPLTLGFMGQPTTDNHDMHDGAFSALGLHHL